MKTKFKNLYQKYQKYLPSKKFLIILLIVFVLVIGISLLLFLSSKKESFVVGGTRNNTALKIENQTISDLMQKDSDGDGISDWEETLWGTDKNKAQTFNNVPDATYIANKKKELNIEQSVNVTKLNETEKFSREFYASFSAMKTSGQVDQNTINNFSSALGQKIVNPSLIDVYTEADIKIDINENSNDPAQKQQYYNNLQKLFESYQSAGIGDELDIINNGLASSGAITSDNQYDKLPIIADAYQNFSKKIMEITVPSELATYHLQIANSSNNTGISVLNMKEIINDPLIGLEGLSQYQKYSADLVKAVGDLRTVLSQ